MYAAYCLAKRPPAVARDDRLAFYAAIGFTFRRTFETMVLFTPLSRHAIEDTGKKLSPAQRVAFELMK